MGNILVLGECQNGHLDDSSKELLTKARALTAGRGGLVSVVAFGPDAREAVQDADADEAVVVTGDTVDDYNPESYERAMADIAVQIHPTLILMANTTMGMDLGAALATRLNQAMIAYCTSLELEGDVLVATCQVYGGKLRAEVEVPLPGAVITVIPGSWASNGSSSSPNVRDQTGEAVSHTKLLKVIEAESGGDVDITREDILVSVGRGLQDPDNLELADELAAAIGGVVSCSRPVVDAGWLPRSRQVGKSGQTVKPKLYLALGISGAPEHLQGMKDAELIVAINSDENAPIFDVAQYGATVDILDLMPLLSEKLQGRAG